MAASPLQRETCMALIAPQETLQSIGTWIVLAKIAESGLGTVYKARSRVSEEVVAIKVLPPFQAGKDQAYQRFARECRILSALNDPHIVRALDFGIDGSSPYLVMEHVEGESLGGRLDREGSLPEAEAVRLIAQIAGALDRAHARKLVHRNVNPDTILITPDGQAKLTDLGMVKEVETQEELTRVGTFLGAPNFMAPEQFFNASRATRSCDVYSLAATLYMAVTGKLPFAGSEVAVMFGKKMKNDLPSPRDLVPTLSEGIDRAIRKAMSPKPDHRPFTCGEFAEELTREGEVKTLVSTEQAKEAKAAAKPACLVVPPSATDELAHPEDSELAGKSTSSLVAKAPVVHADSSWWMSLAAIVGTAAAFLSGLYLFSR
jgi:serine/threonine protein kinase